MGLLAAPQVACNVVHFDAVGTTAGFYITNM